MWLSFEHVLKQLVASYRLVSLLADTSPEAAVCVTVPARRQSTSRTRREQPATECRQRPAVSEHGRPAVAAAAVRRHHVDAVYIHCVVLRHRVIVLRRYLPVRSLLRTARNRGMPLYAELRETDSRKISYICPRTQGTKRTLAEGINRCCPPVSQLQRMPALPHDRQTCRLTLDRCFLYSALNGAA